VHKDRPSNWEPEDEDDYEAASEELKRRFASWVGDQGLSIDPEAPEGPLHYKGGYVDGHLTRWTRADLNAVYLDLYPAKMMVDTDELDNVLAEARAFVTFLAATGLLDETSEPVEVLIGHLEHIEHRFRANMADPSRYSFGKRLWMAAAAEGVSPDDPEATEAFLERFNARPRAEREAILGRTTASRQSATGRFTPPGTRPQPSSSKRRKRRR
jgi:hypothetical protein